MTYCPECGGDLESPHHVTERAAEEVAAELSRADVEIARINADKEIRLAKIQAGIVKDEVLTEAAVEQAHAQGEADGLREAIAPEPMPEPEPIVLGVPEPVEPEPTIEPAEDSPSNSAPSKGRGLGMW